MGAPDTFTLRNLVGTAADLLGNIARAIAPRKPLSVSEWADLHRWLSTKTSPKAGRWRTDNNPPLREPMDCMSVRSSVQEVVLMFPIQFGKSEFETNTLGYVMDHAPAPIMVCLPGEVSMNKWINQKLNPMIESTDAVRTALTTTNSRNAANQKEFKDFAGGQLYVEHAGTPARLKSTTVRWLLVDEFTEFAANLKTGDDPAAMLDGRTSAYPHTYKRAYVSTPGMVGICRTSEKWEKSDQRRYHVPCPHCGEHQPLEWTGLEWSRDHFGTVTGAWYVCRECGALIDERHKKHMLRDEKAGGTARWVPTHPDRKVRGYHINCLYYQPGLGPNWVTLAQNWLDAQADPAKLKTFVNDRLAEPWEDPTMRAVKHNAIRDRAEPYRLRTAPSGVLVITAGVDTQDNRLAVHLTGWGRGMAAWTLDYVELPGDPELDDVWVALTDLINRPIEHESGALLTVQATAIDAGGHRTQAVYNYVRSRMIRRPMAIFGAVPNNAPVLSKGRLQDVDWRGKLDKRGVVTHQVGTVAIKHMLFARLSTDADLDPERRMVHFSDELDPAYYAGIVSETYNPAKNRFDKRRGARNEPLDTWGYSYAATHHPELRLHRKTKADWDEIERRILAMAAPPGDSSTIEVSENPTPQARQSTRRLGRVLR